MLGFLNLNLILELKCIDCGSSNEFKFRLRKYFNLEGNFLEESPEQNVCCPGCGLEVFCDLKKIYSRDRIIKFYDGYKIFKVED